MIYPSLSFSSSGFPFMISQWSKEQLGKAFPLVFSLKALVKPKEEATGKKALKMDNGVPST
jgi:hypothetical protein